MHTCVKYSLDRMDDVHYVENRKRPIFSYQKRAQLALLRLTPSRELLAKEIMCCSLATD